jgi:translation initiation factor 3 subunit J
MADTWDDSDDEWDVEDDDELDARLGLKALSTNNVPVFDDDEDLTLKQKAVAEKEQYSELKKKGNALAARKKAEQERVEEEELARKAMEMEAELEANLSPEELRSLKQKQVEEADHALTDDLFGGVDVGPSGSAAGAAAGDTVVLADLKDHLKHARKVGQCIKVSTRCNVSFQVRHRV